MHNSKALRHGRGMFSTEMIISVTKTPVDQFDYHNQKTVSKFFNVGLIWTYLKFRVSFICVTPFCMYHAWIKISTRRYI